MECKIKTNVFYNVLNKVGVPAGKMQDSIKSKSELISAFSNNTDTQMSVEAIIPDKVRTVFGEVPGIKSGVENILSGIKNKSQEIFTHFVQTTKYSSLTPEELKEYSEMYSDVILQDFKDFYEMNHDTSAETDNTLLAKALSKVSMLDQFGLILTDSIKDLDSLAHKFIAAVKVKKQDIVNFINTIDENGIDVGINSFTLKELSDGSFTSRINAKHLNWMINRQLGRVDGYEDIEYVTQKTMSTVEIDTEQLMEDYNNVYYARYLTQLGEIANSYVDISNTKVDKDSKLLIAQLRSANIVAHQNNRINILRAYKKKQIQRNEDNFAIQSTESRISSLEKMRDSYDSVFNLPEFEIWSREVLDEIKAEVAEYSQLNPEQLKDVLPTEKFMTWINVLKLIQNTTSPYFAINPILDMPELNDDEFKRVVSARSIEAAELEAQLQYLGYRAMEGKVSEKYGTDVSEKFDKFSNIGSGIQNMIQKVFGLHHIDNPLVQYIADMVEEATIRAHSHFIGLTDKMMKMWKGVDDTGFDKNNFMQVDEDGIITGYATDVFAPKWWKIKYTVLDDYFRRKNETISLNPELLFETTGNKKVQEDYKKYLKDMLGDWAYDTYIQKAKDLWENYKLAREHYIAANHFSVTDTNHKIYIRNWEVENSPVHRIQQLEEFVPSMNNITAPGSDNYLIIIPRKVDALGKETGYYDKNYNAIMANDHAKEFYYLFRDIFIKHQLALNNVYNPFSPPELAFVEKTKYELIKEGNFKQYYKESKRDLSSKYLETTVALQQRPKNKVSGNEEEHIRLSYTKITDAIKTQTLIILSQDDYYKDLVKENTEESLQQAGIYKAQIKAQVAKGMQATQTTNLFQSIAMANQATTAFIEKSKIESTIKMAAYFLQDKTAKLKMGFTESNEAIRAAEEIVTKSVNHFLNIRFYDAYDKDSPYFWRKKGRDEQQDFNVHGNIDDNGEVRPAGKYFSSRNFAQLIIAPTRLLVLGWSSSLAVLNVFQALVSNTIKSFEGGEYNPAQLYVGYSHVLSAKNRSLLKKLKLIGDVAYQYDFRNIYSGNSWKDKFHYAWLQTTAEKINQGAVALAILKNTKIVDSNGTVSNVYDELDANGVLDNKWGSEEFSSTGMDLLAEVTQRKIRRSNMSTSGDYFSPLLIEKSDTGKVAMLFHKFIPEMVSDRFGNNRTDYGLGREVVGRFKGAMSWTGKSLRGKETSAAEQRAMRGALAELVIVIGLKMTLLGLRKLLCNTQECKEQKGATLLGLNVLDRLSGDVLFFLDPSSMLETMARPFETAIAFSDFGHFVHSFSSWALPGGDDGLYKQDGDNFKEGDPKMYNDFKKLVPFYRTNYYRYVQMTSKLKYDPMLSTHYKDPVTETEADSRY